jgi:hypothetical protein
MICPSTLFHGPHHWHPVREGVRWCCQCDLFEYDVMGNLLVLPVALFDLARSCVPGSRVKGRLLIFPESGN